MTVDPASLGAGKSCAAPVMPVAGVTGVVVGAVPLRPNRLSIVPCAKTKGTEPKPIHTRRVLEKRRMFCIILRVSPARTCADGEGEDSNQFERRRPCGPKEISL